MVTNDELQSLHVSGTGGTFTLTFKGQTTTAITAPASATAIQSALNALTTIGPGGVRVSQQPDGTFQVRFAGLGLAAAQQPLLTGNAGQLTLGSSSASPSVTVTEVQVGGSLAAQPAGSLEFTGVEMLTSGSVAGVCGAASASLSVWFRLDPSSAPVSNILLFGQTFTTTTFYNSTYLFGLSLGNNACLSAAFQDSAGNSSAQNWVPIQPGVVYHAVVTYASGNQTLYINNVAYTVGKLTNPLYSSPAATFNPIVVGQFASIQYGGAKFRVAEGAIWSGYCLTPQDVSDLFHRAKAPASLATSSLVFLDNFFGPDGATATAGDDGLTDRSSEAADLSLYTGSFMIGAPNSLTYPVYRSGQLTFVPPAHVSSAVIGPSGQTLALLFSNTQTSQPVAVTSIATDPTISVNGGPPVALTAASRLGPFDGKNFVLYFLPNVIHPTDSVTISAPDNWAQTTVGVAATLSAAPVPPPGPNVIVPDLTKTTATMPVGYNVGAPNPANPALIFSNLAKQSGGWQTAQGTPSTDVDVNGYQTASTVANGGTVNYVTLPYPMPAPGTGLYPAAPATGAGLTPSTWTVMWDGASASAAISSGDTITRVGTPVTGQATDNRVDYSIVAAQGQNAPTIRVVTGGTGLTNLRVFPPGIDPANPPLFHPQLLRMAAGARCVRFMDGLGTNGSTKVDPTDFAQPSQMSFTGTLRTTAVVSVAPYPNADGFVDPKSTPILLTTAAPHGLKEGQTVMPVGFAGTDGQGNYPGTNGAVAFNNAEVCAHVISPTQVAFGFGFGGLLTATYTGAQGSGTLQLVANSGWPPAHAVALCNALGADLWLNAPHCLSDAGAAWLASVALGLNPGLKCYLEFSNEAWNYFGGFPQHGWMVGMGASLPGSGATFAVTGPDAGGHLSVSVTSGGSGYDRPRALAFSGLPAGSLAPQIYTQVTGGSVTGLTVLYPGNCPGPPTSVSVGPAPWYEWYVWQMGRVHAAFASAFAAAGRAGDLVRVMGVQGGYPGGTTTPMGQYAQLCGIPVDAIAMAPYFGNLTYDNTRSALFDALTDEQFMDVAEAWAQWAGIASGVIDQYASIRPFFPNAKVVCYEGGPEFGGLTTDATGQLQSIKWARHPRMRGVMLTYLSQLQATGCTLFNDYTLFDIVGNNGLGNAMWGAYMGWNMPAGMGDGSDGLFDNRSNYLDFSHGVSVVGGAINTWNGLIASGSTHRRPQPKRGERGWLSSPIRSFSSR